MCLHIVQERIAADDEGKWDMVLERGEMRMQEGRLRFPRWDRVDYPQGLGLSSWAETQLCHKLAIPVPYFRRCPAALQDVQVNHWIHREQAMEEAEKAASKSLKPERWLLRAKGEKVRGVLSERYARVNNAEIVSALHSLIPSYYEVSWLALTEETFHLRLVDPRLTRELLPGDRVIAGLHIANSEVGRRAVTVDALVWRLVCANGLLRLVKGRSLLHQRHVGLNPGRFEIALKCAVKEAMIQGTGFMERMAWATQEPIRDVDHTLTQMGNAWGLSQTLQEHVKAALRSEKRDQQETLYGLINALTSAAQTLSPDDRYALEAMAGRLLENGLSQTKEKSAIHSLPRFRDSLFEPELLAA